MQKKMERIRIEWESVDGNLYTEWFVVPTSSQAGLGLSYVHVWSNPADGLRRYLSHLPLHNVRIIEEEE